MDSVTGGCLCGALRFLVTGQPFHASAIFPETAVTITGEVRSYRDRSFCPTCGSPVFAHIGDEIGLNLGCFDDTSRFRPTYELWTIRREDWLPAFPWMRHYAKDRESDDRTEG